MLVNLRPCGQFMKAPIWALAGIVIALALAPVAAAAAVAPSRLPVPPAPLQAAAKAKLEQYFIRNYHVLTPSTAHRFSAYLFRKYGHQNGHPVARYVALNLAWKLSARAGDFWVTADSVHLLKISYQIDGFALHLRASRRLFPNLHSRRLVVDLGNYTTHWGKRAMETGDYRPARGLLAMAARCYALTRYTRRLARVRRLASRLAVLEPTTAQLATDEAALKAAPHNSAALVRTALFYWLVADKPSARAKGDKLAQASGSSTLAAIMKLSARHGTTTAAGIHLGNLWWNLAKTHKLLAYTPLVQQHAIEIYSRAVPGVGQAFSAMIGQGNYHAAVPFIAQAKKAAKRTRNPQMLSIASQWNRMVRQARMLHRRYTAALKTIAQKADDPTANQTIGEYLCFLGGQWKSGLPYLKLAGLPGLRHAAKTDLSNPPTPAAQIALGNQWWILARGYRGIMKTNIRLRAAYWYNLALKKLPSSADKALRYRVAKLQASNP